MFRGLPKTLIATSAAGLKAGFYLFSGLCILIFVAWDLPQRQAISTRPPKALKGAEVTPLTTGRPPTLSNHAPKSLPTLTDIHETRRGKVLSVGRHFPLVPGILMTWLTHRSATPYYPQTGYRGFQRPEESLQSTNSLSQRM